MCALLSNFAIIHHHDAISLLHSAQSVRNHNAGAPLHEIVQGFLYRSFGFIIQRTGRLIQYQDGGIFELGTCNV